MKPKQGITSTLTTNLSEADIDELWQFSNQFVERSQELFLRMLLSKDRLYRLRDAGGVLRGCAAEKMFEVEVAGRRHGVFFAALVMIDPAWRGQNILQRMGVESYLSYKLRHPTTPIYICGALTTYHSYRLYAKNLAVYWPHPQLSMPDTIHQIIDGVMQQLMQTMPGRVWYPERCVVGSGEYQHFFSGKLDGNDPAWQTDPDLRFFYENNPGQNQGDGLILLAPLNFSNWLAIGRRMLRRVMRPRQQFTARITQ